MVKMKKGFTLVELSIVLVIIGLLIGGILAAQSMISTAKINAVAMQIGQFDAGVENFKTKYNGLPGDTLSFGGNGDGAISTANGVIYFDYEIGNFWYDIDNTQFSGPAPSSHGWTPVSNGTGKNAPSSKLGINGSFFIASAALALYNPPNGYPDLTNIQNYYVILNPADIILASNYYIGFFARTDSLNSAVKPSDLLALDTKIDDGLGTTGNVRSGSSGQNGGINTHPSPGLCSDDTTGKYVVTDSAYECTPLIRIGASAGDPQ